MSVLTVFWVGISIIAPFIFSALIWFREVDYPVGIHVRAVLRKLTIVALGVLFIIPGPWLERQTNHIISTFVLGVPSGSLAHVEYFDVVGGLLTGLFPGSALGYIVLLARSNFGKFAGGTAAMFVPLALIECAICLLQDDGEWKKTFSSVGYDFLGAMLLAFLMLKITRRIART